MIKGVIRSLSAFFSGMFRGITSSSRSPFAFFICVFALTLAYRILLAISWLTHPFKPFDFNPKNPLIWFVLSYWPYDVILVVACFILFWLLSQLTSFVSNSKASSILRISGLVILHAVLFLLLFIHGTHAQLLFKVQSGFDYSVFMEAFSGVSLKEVLKFVETKDLLFLFLPFGLFWLVLKGPAILRIWMVRFSFALVIFFSLTSFFTPQENREAAPSEIRLNPVLFLLSDISDRVFYKYSAESQKINIKDKNASDNQLKGHEYIRQIKELKFHPSLNTHSWNIVIFVMESVGARYMFDTTHGNPVPMPFLQRLSQKGWYLKKHFSPSNYSTKATFSLLSGLYDFFRRETFALRSDTNVPSIYSYLRERYDGFLVTASPLSWYFPTPFLKNSGPFEIHSYENLNFQMKEAFHSLGHYIARDEIQTVDFFIQRLDRAKEPFLAIYMSFVAHFPYFDYGESYRIVKEDGRLISRYYNNLNLLDRQIRRIYDHLKEKGLLERTILVIVGDHGQAFGQHHPDNYMHYRYSYNENLETSAIIYQPALFEPKAFESPTSHVDLLPTLLDALRVPYDPLLFDGESLIQHQLKRRYLFFYGYEGSISSLDIHSNKKVQYSLKKNRCWVFDLKLDPDENSSLDCSSYQPQLEALFHFVRSHDSKLVQYNDECIAGKKSIQRHRRASF